MPSILFMIVGYTMQGEGFVINMSRLKELTNSLIPYYEISFAGLSSKDNFEEIEGVLPFKYKEVYPDLKQLGKVCTFISSCPDKYDWYVKIRPNMYLNSLFEMSDMCPKSVNARARYYIGPRIIPFGHSFSNCGCYYSETEKEEELILDDQMYIFSRHVVELGGFDVWSLDDELISAMVDLCIESALSQNYKHGVCENEVFHTAIWAIRQIPLNVVGINHAWQFSSHLIPDTPPPWPRESTESCARIYGWKLASRLRKIWMKKWGVTQ